MNTQDTNKTEYSIPSRYLQEISDTVLYAVDKDTSVSHNKIYIKIENGRIKAYGTDGNKVAFYDNEFIVKEGDRWWNIEIKDNHMKSYGQASIFEIDKKMFTIPQSLELLLSRQSFRECESGFVVESCKLHNPRELVRTVEYIDNQLTNVEYSSSVTIKRKSLIKALKIIRTCTLDPKSYNGGHKVYFMIKEGKVSLDINWQVSPKRDISLMAFELYVKLESQQGTDISFCVNTEFLLQVLQVLQTSKEENVQISQAKKEKMPILIEFPADSTSKHLIAPIVKSPVVKFH